MTEPRKKFKEVKNSNKANVNEQLNKKRQHTESGSENKSRRMSKTQGKVEAGTGGSHFRVYRKRVTCWNISSRQPST